MLTPFEEELFVGSKFAERYQILSVVGRGSMGVVYKARHELMGRLVAIKMLRGQLALDERSVKRFEREARAASRLDHPNVIAVHDFGLTENRQPYLVMDYANGVTLYEIQKREQILNVERAVHIFSQVCDALHHAHLQGVIHRDLKPSNIMVVAKEHDPNFVKVFDLGVAKIAWGEEEEKEAITGTGEVCGSPVYLSPEQCTHSALDHRTDIYSLGVIMYELLTGSPPLMGETVYDTIYLHVHEAPPPFKDVTEAPISARLEAIVMKALAKNPDDRHQSMQELKWDLQASIMQSDPIRVLPPNDMKPKRSSASPKPELPEPKEKDVATRTKILVSGSTAERMAAYNGSGRMKASSGEIPKPTVPPPPGLTPPGLLDTVKERIQSTNPIVIGGVSLLGGVLLTLAVMSAFSPKQAPSVTDPVAVEPSTGATPAPSAQPVPTPKAPPANRARHTEPSIPSVPTTAAPPRFSLLTETPTQPHTVSSSRRRRAAIPASTDPVMNPPIASMPPATSAAPAPASPANFFSIFMPGNSTAPHSVQSTKSRAKLMAKAKSAVEAAKAAWQQAGGTLPNSAAMPSSIPSQSPTFGMPAPSGPSPEDITRSRILNNEAVAAMSSDPMASVTKLNHALKLDPTYTKAKTNLGRAYHNLANRQSANGDTFSAVNSYRKALNLLTETVGPDNPDTRQTKDDYEALLQTAGATTN